MKYFVLILFLLIITIFNLLSSCISINEANSDFIYLSGNSVIAGVKAKVFDIKIKGVISKSDIVYNSQKYLLLSKINKDFTEILLAKPGAVDIQKGETLFTVRKNFKILEVFPINKLPEEKKKIGRVTENQDGISFIDFCALEDEQATLVIHMKDLPKPETGLKAIRLKISYPPEYLDLDKSRHGNDDPDGFAKLMSNSNNYMLDEPSISDGTIYITIVAKSGNVINFDDEDVLAVYFVVEEVNAKTEFDITGKIINYVDSNLQEYSVKPSLHYSHVVIYDPKLLGDMDEDYDVDITDFVQFLNAYNTLENDEDYNIKADIYPAFRLPSNCSPNWKDIWGAVFPDGKVDVYDFAVFASNYGKVMEGPSTGGSGGGGFTNNPPSNVNVGDGTNDDTTGNPDDGDGYVEADNITDVPITDVYLEFRASDPDGDVLNATIYFGKTQDNMSVYATQLQDNDTGDNDSDDNQWLFKITDVYGTLEYGQTYYWKVVIDDGKGGEITSDTWSFTTVSLNYMLFTAGAEGVYLLNVNNLNSISVQAAVDTPGYAYTAVKTGTGAGDHIFVADGSGGVAIIDIAAGPALSLNSEKISVGGEVLSVEYYSDGSNDYVYAGIEGYVKIYDVTSISDIELKSSISVSGRPMSLEVRASGDNVYLFIGTDSGTMYIYDVTTATSPNLVSTVDLGGQIQYIVYAGYLYVAKGNNGIGIIDISDITNPSEIGSLDTSGKAEALEVKARDNRLYVADGVGGIVIVDISDKTSPSILGTKSTKGYASGIRVVGNYAYVSDKLEGLQVYNINVPSDISWVAEFNSRVYARGVSNVKQLGAGRYIAVADGSGGIEIFRVDSGFSEDMESIFHIEPGGYVRDVYILEQSTKYFLISAEGENGISVYSLDFNDNGVFFESNDVQQIAHYDTDGYSYSICVYPDAGNTGRIYIADGANGLITIPYTINGANSFDLDTENIDHDVVNNGVAMHVIIGPELWNGRRLIVADGSEGVGVFELTDLNDPEKITEKNIQGTAYQLYLDENRGNLWIADGSKGVAVIRRVITSFLIFNFWDDDWSNNKVRYGPPSNNKTFVGISDDSPSSNYIYFAVKNEGIIRLRINNTSISYSDIYEIFYTQGTANDLVYENDGTDYRLFVADGENGLIRINDPLNMNDGGYVDLYWLNLTKSHMW